MNSVALAGSTDAATATAYSISQQLVTSAWNVVFAVVIVSWVFGWTGGKALVQLLLRRREGEKPRDERPAQGQEGARSGVGPRLTLVAHRGSSVTAVGP